MIVITFTENKKNNISSYMSPELDTSQKSEVDNILDCLPLDYKLPFCMPELGITIIKIKEW